VNARFVYMALPVSKPPAAVSRNPVLILRAVNPWAPTLQHCAACIAWQSSWAYGILNTKVTSSSRKETTVAKKTYRERALAAYFRSLAQQKHVGIPLDHLPSRTLEATLDERDYITVCHGSRILAVYVVRPNG